VELCGRLNLTPCRSEETGCFGLCSQPIGMDALCPASCSTSHQKHLRCGWHGTGCKEAPLWQEG
jgi:hypothetical protein